MTKASPQVSKHLTAKPVRTGQNAGGVRPGHTGQIGTALGTHATEASDGVGTKHFERMLNGMTPPSVELGNARAVSTKCGPGGSRTVMRSGAQGMHGPAAPGNPSRATTDVMGRK